MVGRGEVDEDLEAETKEECEKYGKVVKCVIFEVISRECDRVCVRACVEILMKCLPWQISDVSDDEAVRIFLEFERVESAIKGERSFEPLCFMDLLGTATEDVILLKCLHAVLSCSAPHWVIQLTCISNIREAEQDVDQTPNFVGTLAASYHFLSSLTGSVVRVHASVECFLSATSI